MHHMYISGYVFMIRTPFIHGAARAVQHELDVIDHRNDLIDQMEMERKEAETPEPSGDEEGGEEGEEEDPVLLLSRLYPEAPLDVAEQQDWSNEKDWTDTIRTLQPLEENSSMPWISLQRDHLGDELSPDSTSTMLSISRSTQSSALPLS